MSFSLPNFFFHTTTAYDILRHKGAPLGKRDFMGKMKLKGKRATFSQLLRCMSFFMAQTRSADRIERRLSLEAKRKTSTRDEYFVF